jgi:hypothetical protein
MVTHLRQFRSFVELLFGVVGDEAIVPTVESY